MEKDLLRIVIAKDSLIRYDSHEKFGYMGLCKVLFKCHLAAEDDRDLREERQKMGVENVPWNP